jgi:hypothetical protein|uniref:Uncharacterized protein n=1 Tax=Zea mays TaxID=4577 RepID=A0A804PIR8_MAIZE
MAGAPVGLGATAPRGGGQGSARREDLGVEDGDRPELEHERSDLELVGVLTTAEGEPTRRGSRRGTGPTPWLGGGAAWWSTALVGDGSMSGQPLRGLHEEEKKARWEIVALCIIAPPRGPRTVRSLLR